MSSFSGREPIHGLVDSLPNGETFLALSMGTFIGKKLQYFESGR